MYTKILVPLDGSKLSETILPYARFLAGVVKARVELLHAVDPEVISTFVSPKYGRYVDVVEADMKQHSLDYLQPVASSFPEPSSVDCSAEIGKPAEVILKKASTSDGTLIAMATHGRSGVQRWVLGSVAIKVLHMSTNHLLLVRPSETIEVGGVASLKTAVVPLDGSRLAEKVLPYVTALAKHVGLDVVLLRVYALPASAYFATEEYTPDLPDLTAKMKSEAKDYLEGKVRQLQAEGLDRVSSVVLEGNAAGEIIDFARQTPDNLVAMCTHGRSGIGRWVLGSVTERVVCHSGDPVLVIRARV